VSQDLGPADGAVAVDVGVLDIPSDGNGGAPSVPCVTAPWPSPPLLKKVPAVDKTIAGAGQVVAAPGEPGLIYVLGHTTGNISVVQNGVVAASPLVSVLVSQAVGNEQGLLSMAFHPQFAKTRLFYVFYTGPGGNTTVDEFLRDTPITATFQRNVYSFGHVGPHHNGGSIFFNPRDASARPLLFLAVGNDEDRDVAQSAAQLDGRYGRLLRFDVSTGQGVPAPTGGVGGFTWDYGLRNPYRASVDRLTGDIWIADVGETMVERLLFEPFGSGGRNWGYVSAGTEAPAAPAIATLPTAAGAIIGGVVYRGNKIPGLCGRYFYGHFKDGAIYSLVQDNGSATNKITHDDIGAVSNLSSFGEDSDGEVYVSSNNGQVYRIEAGP
jgi:glucose/arabinose dehydrogenase